MRNLIVLAAVAAAGIATPAFAQVAYNSAPADGFNYGTGNNYNPANAAVLTTPAGPYNTPEELALRFHLTGQPASASDNSGVYSFALGTNPISFDWSVEGSQYNAQITLTNLLTGATVSYNPFASGNDNYAPSTDTDLAQNSERLNFAFLSGLGFDPNVNDTYRATLTSGGQSLTAYAKIGSGVPAVPEPATWGLMILGFGAIGFQLRRSQKSGTALSQVA
ncbi:MAG TPA: PEPxxWA-CTERM sorting domain-containing protein [Sphingomicrobium sp.]|nr:PEPxxWA-CTERM sorting domain-containing protein [Sphingomicrobium sp.]